MICLLTACTLPGRAAPAAGRAAELLAALSARFRAMTSYETEFAVTAGDQCVTGRYVVAGDRYYIAVGDVEAFADGQVRREVDNRHREVTLVAVETENRNILSDPAHAFDLLDGAYRPTLLAERDGTAQIRLDPVSGGAAPIGVVTVTLDTATLSPRSLVYDYDGERVAVAIGRGVAVDIVRVVSGAALPQFDPTRYSGYEFIDFR